MKHKFSPMPQNLTPEARLKDLEEAVEALHQLVNTMSDLPISDSRNELLDDALVMALLTIVLDLADRAGVSSDTFRKHVEIRRRWWHDFYLRKAEDVSAEGAAELDWRTVEQANVGDSYPSIFDPLPGEEQ